MRFVPLLLIGLMATGCVGNSFEERLLAQINGSALGPDGSAEVRFSAPSDKRYFFQIYLSPSAVPDSVRSSYQNVTSYLDGIESDLIGTRLEVESTASGFRDVVELTPEGPTVQWGYTSEPIYGFWSNWPGTELPAGDYVFRLALPNGSARYIESVTVERVIYETGP